MKPRSIIKTVQWFPYFAALKGENWNAQDGNLSKKDNKPIHPVRRSYIYSAHGDEDTWLSSISFPAYQSGEKDIKETESNGRNDKTTFEFFGFGYVDQKGIIKVTPAGEKIVRETFDQEDYLKQLLKLHLPNQVTKTKESKIEGCYVFPFQLVLEAFEEFESLNRSEIALLFGCVRYEDRDKMIAAIRQFKEAYAKLPNKNDTKEVKRCFQEAYETHYEPLPNAMATFYDYAEAFTRSLLYTGLFETSGRSFATKLRVSEHSKLKIEMLREHQFVHPGKFETVDAYMAWYGDTANVILPWENPEERKRIIQDKIRIYNEKLEESNREFGMAADAHSIAFAKINSELSAIGEDSRLKEIEQEISGAITSHAEEVFIKYTSKTKAERQKIQDKFDDILDNDDMSALWLEVNTWKSLIAMQGSQLVKRNFKIEEDLTPRSFAKGVGNTPDMEVYTKDYVLIPEVSLMTGVRQWEHEGSSVIEHVLRFINENEEKEVLGFFLSSNINRRTLWQFFILCRDSWLGKPVPVIPLTIKEYMGIIKKMYKQEWDMDVFKKLLEEIAEEAKTCANFEEWDQVRSEKIEKWC